MDLKRPDAELQIGPGAVCEHDGPASVSAALGGYYARCARCRALGPVRENPEGARLALLECGPASRSEKRVCATKEGRMSEEKHDRPRQEASEPGRGPAPGDEVEPGTQGAAEDVCPECGGKGRLDSGESCPNCNGTGVVIRAVGGGG